MAWNNSHCRGTDALILGLAVLLLAGCSAGNGRQKVSGTVTVDDAPLERGSISFRPVVMSQAAGSGTTVLDGAFQVPASQGLAPGKYLVTVQAFEKTGRIMHDPMGGDRPEMVPVVFRESHPLEATVAAGAANRFEFLLTTDRKTTGASSSR